jgi:hypothetical protein
MFIRPRGRGVPNQVGSRAKGGATRVLDYSISRDIVAECLPKQIQKMGHPNGERNYDSLAFRPIVYSQMIAMVILHSQTFTSSLTN